MNFRESIASESSFQFSIGIKEKILCNGRGRSKLRDTLFYLLADNNVPWDLPISSGCATENF